MCGGTSTRYIGAPGNEGLSPRVRGNRVWDAVQRADAGSIPACAGEPSRTAARNPLPRVYPRVCGGTKIVIRNQTTKQGLSPRVRGNLLTDLSVGLHQRSIPACAGEPHYIPLLAAIVRVYPRVCGGTVRAFGVGYHVDGLSPRVRGNPQPAQGDDGIRRSIPACAGEPPPPGSPLSASWVYPRVCGGTRCRCRSGLRTRGLSPRVRGNPSPSHSRNHSPGSIPACAGEPAGVGRQRDGGAVYPRVCGGTNGMRANAYYRDGLSPRVRGNRHPPAQHHRRPRSIPACAGEPIW